MNKELAKIFGIDEYTQWLITRLDYLEERLFTEDLNACKYIELKGEYDALIEARNKYCELSRKK